MYINSDGLRACPKCDTPHRFAKLFDTNKRAADGLHSQCKACRKRYRSTHKAQQTAYLESKKERQTAWNHYKWAHTPNQPNFKHYQHMQFHQAWDTAPGTPDAAAVFAANAVLWIKAHCPAPRPGHLWALHVDKTEKYPFGYFGPDGIRWMPRIDMHQKLELAQAMRIVEQAGYIVIPAHLELIQSSCKNILSDSVSLSKDGSYPTRWCQG
jgi:hypothetical protein